MFSYPNIGATVWCFFANGDQNLPVYFAMTLGGDVATIAPDNGFRLVRQNKSDDGNGGDTTRTGKDAQQHAFVIGNCTVVITEPGMISMTTVEGNGKGPNRSEIIFDQNGEMKISATRKI